jgi:DNA-directed RNA polymerase subunit M/transcription elongation factor TFIIS
VDLSRLSFPKHPSTRSAQEIPRIAAHTQEKDQEKQPMAVGAKIAKTADRKKVMDTSKSTDCPKCGKSTRIVKRMKDRERNVPGGIYISCSACEFYEKL